MGSLIVVVILTNFFLPFDTPYGRLVLIEKLLQGKRGYFSTLPLFWEGAESESIRVGYTLYLKVDSLGGGELRVRGRLKYRALELLAEPYIRRGRWGEFPRKEWQGLVSGGFKRLYILKNRGWYFWLLGREKLAWGSGRPHPLSLGGGEAGKDMVLLGLRGRRWQFLYFFAPLEVIPRDTVRYTNTFKYNRYMAGHRLTFGFKDLLLGFSETVVFGGLSRFPDWAYLNPVYPFYIRQYYRGDNNSNTLWGFDAIYWFGNGSRLFFDILIDDFPYKPSHGETPKFGLSGGLDILNRKRNLLIELSYTIVNSWTYHHKSYWLNYAYMGDPMGHPLGSNFELLHFEVVKGLSAGYFILSLEWMKRGYQDFDRPKPMLGDTVLFLESPTEEIYSLGVDFLRGRTRVLNLGITFAVVLPYEGKSYNTASVRLWIEKP